MPVRWLALPVCCLMSLCAGLMVACSGSSTATDAAVDQGFGDEGSNLADDGAPAADPGPGADDGSAPGDRADESPDTNDGGDTADGADAGTDVTPDAGSDGGEPADGGGWRSSLSNCWNDVNCKRALIVSHGGDWTATIPYGSHGAFQRAYDNGADGIKCDLRMTKDGVAVAAHSSPIQIYESLDCTGQKIEEMTAAQVTACHLFPSTTETFQRVDDVLNWARGKITIMLTVKLSTDFAGGIATAEAAGAQDYAYFETGVGDMLTVIPSAPNWDHFRYNVEINATADVDTVLNAHLPQVFLYELNPTYPDATAQQVTDIINNKLHPAGVKAFAATNADPLTATLQNHLDLFHQGFDVVMSYNLANGVTARTQINQERGVSPP